VNLPPDVVRETRINYKDMTVEELRGVRDSVKHIEHLVAAQEPAAHGEAQSDARRGRRRHRRLDRSEQQGRAAEKDRDAPAD
jgi:hypothetical protein